MTSPCQKEKNNKIKNIKRKIYQTFIKKYEKLSQKYNTNIIDNIIYNERAHIVALFKDRLITDDNGEFLKRYYRLDESALRLPKFFEYYDLYSKIFPNYTSLPEGKYFYQNIQKKQKMIDIQEQIEFEKQKRKNENKQSIQNINNDNDYNINNNSKDNDFVFSTDVINSILNGSNMEFIELLFNVDKNNLDKEEDIFKEKINGIVNIINNYENYNKNKNNQEKKHQSSSGKKNKNNKSNSGKKNKINNTVLGNDLNNYKISKLNYFNKSTFRKNTIFNLNNNKKTNNLIYLKNNNINKNNKNENNYIKLIEQNIFKKKAIIIKL